MVRPYLASLVLMLCAQACAPNIDGAERYQALCASCHGASGEGGSAPKLSTWKRGKDALELVIGTRMPKDDPSLCRGDCSRAVAAYVVDVLARAEGGSAGGGLCSDEPVQERRLRLLTRSEYRATVADLFGVEVATCGEHTFTYSPVGKNPTKVHVAGSFNGWAGTIAAGGWPMTKTSGMWTLTRTLPVGMHTYKFVLDESEWISDAANPASEADGFGGTNSVVSIACDVGGGALDEDPTRGFPAEVRPDTFAFDDHAGAQVVTAVHVDEYLRAAKDVARAALLRKPNLVTIDTLVGTFGERIFRRPLLPSEVSRYRALGIDRGLAAMLASSSFLYRSEVGVPSQGEEHRLDGYEIASELSYLMWGTMPDSGLFEAARSGTLDTAEGIDREARRLLADPRARAQLGKFALQWLGADNVARLDKQAALFPDFTDAVRAALPEETQRFFAHVVFDGSHGFEELLTADYSFLNAPLAKLYDVSAATALGADFIRTTVPEARRAGLLGHGAVLASYAHSDQTSPIRRGLFVRRRILCEELPPPPPNAGGVPEVDPTATTRERFFQHTANPACSSCHRYIDGVGFGFERFDPIGRYRESDGGKTIDASGDMNDVESLGSETSAPYQTLPELGAILAKSARAKSCFARQYYAFARGVIPEGEGCAPGKLLARFADSGYDVRELMLGVTQLKDFRVRR